MAYCRDLKHHPATSRIEVHVAETKNYVSPEPSSQFDSQRMLCCGEQAPSNLEFICYLGCSLATSVFNLFHLGIKLSTIWLLNGTNRSLIESSVHRIQMVTLTSNRSL